LPQNSATYFFNLFNRTLVIGKTDEAVAAFPRKIWDGCDTCIWLTESKMARFIHPERGVSE
jgi:hypothetical protein